MKKSVKKAVKKRPAKKKAVKKRVRKKKIVKKSVKKKITKKKIIKKKKSKKPIKSIPKTVLVFGTFDLIHRGHTHFLRAARRYGILNVVVSRDYTVKNVKGHTTMNKEQTRLKQVKALRIARHVHLGNLGDKYKIIETIQPDLICLGYDQEVFTHKLTDELKARKLKTKVKRLKSFRPDIFKSTFLKHKLNRIMIKKHPKRRVSTHK